MTDTWGIPGPAFAGIYLFLILIPAVLAAVQVGRARVGRQPGQQLRSLGEVAMLAGGPVRVTDTVVADLVDREQLRFDSLGRLHRTSLHQPSDELGKAAVALVRPTGSSLDTIRWDMRDSEPVKQLRDGLVERGLLIDAREVRRPWKFAAIAYGALLLLGVVRLISGASAGHPVGFLVALLVLVLIALVVSVVKAADGPVAKPTKAGKATLDEVWQQQDLIAGTPGSVALGGLSSHPDQAIRRAAGQATPARARANHSGSGWIAGGGFFGGSASSCGGGGGASCGGGGSSCGGGGGGGGGCGG
jgi:uncharacterized protein (TIGR04222 family)